MDEKILNKPCAMRIIISGLVTWWRLLRKCEKVFHWSERTWKPAIEWISFYQFSKNMFLASWLTKYYIKWFIYLFTHSFTHSHMFEYLCHRNSTWARKESKQSLEFTYICWRVLCAGVWAHWAPGLQRSLWILFSGPREIVILIGVMENALDLAPN